MRDSSFSSLDSSEDGAAEAQNKRARTATRKGARSWRRGLVKGRERNVSRVSRLSIVLSRFARCTASSEGCCLREVDLLPVSGVLFAYVAGELKAENDILRKKPIVICIKKDRK
jgi:hypothetical protein